MKRLILAVSAAVFVFTSCVKEMSAPEMMTWDLYAQIDQEDQTRTMMDENNNIRWMEGDQIVAFMKTSLGLKYQLKEGYAGKTYGSFSKISTGSGDDLDAGMEWDHIVAYYPYSEGIECEKSDDDYVLDVVLPSEQSYVAASFGNGAFPMVSVAEDNDITFSNVCGGMMLQLKGTALVKSITVEGNNSESLSGSAVVTAYTDGTKPAIAMTSTDAPAKSVTLNCGSGIQLNESTATEFIIALPPVVFTKGFSVTVTDTERGIQTIETEKENEVLRSSLLKMPEVTYRPEAVNLSASGTANSYIVSEPGSYRFTPTKGNCSESVGTIVNAEVLWETFGTDVAPSVGDLVKNVSYKDGYIAFEATDKKGNAVIAAKDASGNILWSWHIWLTDQPEGQVYFNNAGTMMDRNLGATSATPGDVGALGLLYQWGRKDPFLGSSLISSDTEAVSTINWPSAVGSTSETGTIDYVTANPTTYVTYNNNNNDWYYTGTSSTDNTRWQSEKTIYDPCPAGWRVPDGGSSGVWSTALGSSSSFSNEELCDSANEGMNFSGKFGSASTIWYPTSGNRYSDDGGLYDVGSYGLYWSVSPSSYDAYSLLFLNYGFVYPSYNYRRARGFAVRCLQVTD